MGLRTYISVTSITLSGAVAAESVRPYAHPGRLEDSSRLDTVSIGGCYYYYYYYYYYYKRGVLVFIS